MNLRRRSRTGTNRGRGFRVVGMNLRASSGSGVEAVYPGIQFTVAPGLGGQTGRPREKTYRRSANDSSTRHSPMAPRFVRRRASAIFL